MDAVSLALANDYTRKAAVPQHAYTLLSKLDIGQNDVVLGVLGDSTGNATSEWVYLLTQWLATRYPTHTVNYRLWNDGAQAYDTPVVIQTGSGSRTLYVYNASTPGESPSYSSDPTRLGLQLPVQPDLVFVNYGHNNTGVTAYRPTYWSLIRRLTDRWPRTNLIVVAQNPRRTTDAEYSNGLVRNQCIVETAAAENFGLVNVTQRFLDYGAGRDADLMTDDVHPNNAGHLVWVDEVKKHFRRGPQLVPAGPIARPTRVLIPASQFIGSQGTPDLGLRNSLLPAWALDQSTQESVVCVADIPSTWGSANVYILWTANGGSTNDVRWVLNRDYLNQTQSGNVEGYFIGSNVVQDGAVTAAASTVALSTRASRIVTDVTYTQKPLLYEVIRDADAAADTLAQDVWFYGLLLERAS